MIIEASYNDDYAYLNDILMGNGWTQYNNLTDEQIKIEYLEETN